MLNDRFPDYPIRNYQFGYVIDTQKGVYVDSQSMNQEQFSKYYRTYSNCNRPDLSYSQAIQFSLKYLLGQRLLWVKKKQNLAQITKLVRSSNRAFIQNNLSKIFGKSYASCVIGQNKSAGGYMRTDEDRQKIANWGYNRYQNAKNLGLLPLDPPDGKTQQERVDNIANILRERYVNHKHNQKQRVKAKASSNDEQ